MNNKNSENPYVQCRTYEQLYSENAYEQLYSENPYEQQYSRIP